MWVNATFFVSEIFWWHCNDHLKFLEIGYILLSPHLWRIFCLLPFCAPYNKDIGPVTFVSTW